MSDDTKVAIVSGGSRGLGARLVEDFLADGFCVATFSRGRSASIDALEQSDPEGERFFWQPLDVRNTQELREFVRGVTRRWGPVEVLVNNAGVSSEGLLSLAPESDIEATIAINLESAIHLTRACFKSMMVARRGTVINISSINAVRGHKGVAVYSATKAALDGFMRSLAREVGPMGVRVNSVAPGYFDSAMTEHLPDTTREKIVRRIPLKRLGTDADIANVIRFLASDHAAYIHGQTIVVDGGMSS